MLSGRNPWSRRGSSRGIYVHYGCHDVIWCAQSDVWIFNKGGLEKTSGTGSLCRGSRYGCVGTYKGLEANWQRFDVVGFLVSAIWRYFKTLFETLRYVLCFVHLSYCSISMHFIMFQYGIPFCVHCDTWLLILKAMGYEITELQAHLREIENDIPTFIGQQGTDSQRLKHMVVLIMMQKWPWNIRSIPLCSFPWNIEDLHELLATLAT